MLHSDSGQSYLGHPCMTVAVADSKTMLSVPSIKSRSVLRGGANPKDWKMNEKLEIVGWGSRWLQM